MRQGFNVLEKGEGANMAVYVECPSCHRKQSLENDECRACGCDIHSARKRNRAAYWVYLRYRGRQIWERIGPSLTVAREQEKLLRARLVSDEYAPANKTTRIQLFFERSFLPWAKREKKSWKNDERRFKLHILPAFGNHKLKDIRPTQVETFKEARIKEGAKNATVNRDLALLKTIFNKATKWGLYQGQNPVSLAGMLPENNEHIARCLTEEEFEKLFNELPRETKPIFEFAIATGARIGNILNLKWDQIDKVSRIIYLPKTKSGKALKLPLNDWALEILNSIFRHIRSPYVFCRLDGKHYKDIRGGFKNALKRAKLDTTIRIHDLRHTYASWMAAKGTPTSILKDLLGHSTLAMVNRYTHLGHQTLLEMANRMTPPFGKSANHIANKGNKIEKKG
jgi:integrase